MGQQISHALVAATDIQNRVGTNVETLGEKLGGILQYEKGLGSTRFTKTIRYKHSVEGPIVVKIFKVPDEVEIETDKYIDGINKQHEILGRADGVISYVTAFRVDKCVYLVRQYLRHNLYDRISRRPFLNDIDKIWITFQLLVGLQGLHNRGIIHGDIKIENVVLTSWEWVYFTDIGSFKPIYLPDDDPANFTFFFDLSGRRTCYVAPERFVNAKTEQKKLLDRNTHQLEKSMDIFSLGCVIAELFIENTGLFKLSQLLKYKKGEYDPTETLAKVKNVQVRALIEEMIQREPGKRRTAKQYLEKYKGKLFPVHLYENLYKNMSKIGNILPQQKKGKTDVEYLKVQDLGESIVAINDLEFNEIVTEEKIKTVSDWRIAQLQDCWCEIIMNTTKISSQVLLNFIFSNLEVNSFATSKRIALLKIQELRVHVDDEVVMDRIVPNVVPLLEDEEPAIRGLAIEVLSRAMEDVITFKSIDKNIFEDVFIPRIKKLCYDKEEIVRISVGKQLVRLAEIAERITFSFISREDEWDKYRDAKRNLAEMFVESTSVLLSDSSSEVKSAILDDIENLVLFFSRNSTAKKESSGIDFIIGHLITFLNSRDSWQLKVRFLESLHQPMALFGGKYAVEEYIVPLIMTAVEDPEEFVIAAALYAFEKLNYMGMVGQKSMMSIVDKCKPLLIHPNTILSGHSKKLIQSAVKKHGEKWFMIYNKLYRDNLINYLPFKPLNAEEFELVLAEKLTKKQYYYGLSEPGDELSLLKGFRRSKQRILESAAERLEPTLCARELGLTLHTMFITQQDIEGYDSDTDYSSNESNCGDVDGSENENCTGNESDSNSDLSIGIRDRSYIRESSMGKSQSGLATGGQFTTKSGPHTLTPQEPSFGMSYSDGMAQRLDAVGTPIGMSPGYQGNKQSPTVQLSSKTASAIFSKPHAIHKMDGGPEHASNSTPDRFNSSEQFFPNRKKERANSKAEIDCVKIGKYDHKHTILKLVRRKAVQIPKTGDSAFSEQMFGTGEGMNIGMGVGVGAGAGVGVGTGVSAGSGSGLGSGSGSGSGLGLGSGLGSGLGLSSGHTEKKSQQLLLISNLLEHRQKIISFDYCGKKNIIFCSLSDDGGIKLWSLDTFLTNIMHKSITTINTSGKKTVAKFLNNQEMLICSDNGLIKRYSIFEKKTTLEYLLSNGYATHLCVLNQHCILVATDTNCLLKFKLLRSKFIVKDKIKLNISGGKIAALSICKTTNNKYGKFALVSLKNDTAPGKVYLIDLRFFIVVKELTFIPDWLDVFQVDSMEIFADHFLLMSCKITGLVVLYNLKTDKIVGVFSFLNYVQTIEVIKNSTTNLQTQSRAQSPGPRQNQNKHQNQHRYQYQKQNQSQKQQYQYPHLSGSIYGVGSDGYFLVTSNYYGLLLWNFKTLSCLQFFPSSTTPTNVSSPLIYGQSSTKLAVLSQTFNGIDFHCVENITLTGTLVKHNNILFPTIHAHENNQNKPVGSSSGGDQNYYNLRSLISSVKIIPLNEGFGALFPNSVYGSSNYNTTGHSRSNSSYSNKNVNDSYNNGGLSGTSGSHNFVQSTILEKFSFVLLLGYFNGVIDVFLF